MNDHASFDAMSAHKYFSADCFNRSWQLIDKSVRTAEDDLQLIHLAHTSLWHWTQRPDCIDTNLSIGYWLLSRVYALLGDAEQARRYGELCLAKSAADDSFCLGYAHEALARAASLAGQLDLKNQHLAHARRHAEKVTDVENQRLLTDDLTALE